MMKLKENCGCDPVTMDRGFTKLSGPIPNAGDSITTPQPATREMYAMMEGEEAEGGAGFLEREMPNSWERPVRTKEEDRG